MTKNLEEAKIHLEFTGLTAKEVEESRKLHGDNLLTPPPKTPWWKLFLEKFEDPIIRILLVAAVIAIMAGMVEGHYTEGIGIIIAVFLATGLAFINEYRAEQEFDILNQVLDEESIMVIRESNYTTIPKKDLVVGDILVLEQGIEIPADAEILEATAFKVNESSLTGESVPVSKRPKSDQEDGMELAYPRHQVLRGTFVSDGHALARITAVGDSSEMGRTARAAAEETEVETPLNQQLAKLGQVIGVCGFTIAILVFSVLTIGAVFQGKLGDQISIGQYALDSNIEAPSLEMKALARQIMHNEHGVMFEELPILSKSVDGIQEFYVQMPLTGGQLYFIVITFIAAVIALTRVWLPIWYDAKELRGLDRPENAWLEQEGFTPLIQTLVAALIFFGVFVGLGILFGFLPSSPSLWIPTATGLTLLSYFMVAVTIIVVAVPEGLPMSVVLSLAYSMRKMTANNNLVRRMHACETIGAATVICSDKTGTLTMNKMQVSSHNFTNLNNVEEAQNMEWDLIAEAISINSTAHLGEDNQGNLTLPLGNPTEAALLLWLAENNVFYEKLRESFHVKGQLTFSSEKKYMATVGTTGTAGTDSTGQNSFSSDKILLHVKGAPEIIIGRCSSKRLANGDIETLTDQDREQLINNLKSEQSRGMRTLGFAYKSIDELDKNSPELESEQIQNYVEDNTLIWLGFFSIADPIRPEVFDAVNVCKNAGVGVKMVTGDNHATAAEIASQIGMINREDDNSQLIVTGDEFMAMEDEEAEETAKRIKIMSRARPLAKQRLVRLLQKQNEVVAVTGDGSNDAPALNYADVGLSMGIAGTSVAKAASDIILLDDSFASITKAIMWGRSLYANIQKFILFQLTINVTALGIALLGPFIGVQLPLTVTQMLWVNLIMDTFAALALASEPPDWSVMTKPPRNPESFIVTRPMAEFILTVGGIFIAMFLILVLGFGNQFPMDTETQLGQHNLSIFFSVFVFLQFWNLFNAKMLGQTKSVFTQLTGNKLFLLIAIIIAIGQILITQFGGSVFRTTPLSTTEWLWIIIGTSPVLLLGELLRWKKRIAG